MVENLSDADIMRLNRGGHDPFKVYAAYHAAVNHRGEPTVILAKTVKGYGMGEGGESENTTHAVKKLGLENLKHFRDQFGDSACPTKIWRACRTTGPVPDTPEMVYLQRNRERLGGFIPRRVVVENDIKVPDLSIFDSQLKGSGDREISTTMVFVRMLASLVRDKDIGSRVVPIVPDEARTFGMEGMFRQLGIYSSEGQIYEPEDSDEIAGYRESKEGQVLEEGINEAGAISAWIAAATVVQLASKDARAVLHLLFDVRLSAHRRFCVGGRRHSGARISARRHRGSHHAERRRTAASGRTQSSARRRRFRTAVRTIRHTAMNWRSSFIMA